MLLVSDSQGSLQGSNGMMYVPALCMLQGFLEEQGIIICSLADLYFARHPVESNKN